MTQSILGGTLTPAEGFTITRMGYGAMQLAGPGVFGPPRDHDEAIAVLRSAVEQGVTHIDTSDFYGPTVVNELIREALHPYPENLQIVTKVGARRDAEGGWLPALGRQELIDAVHDNLTHLGVDVLDAVNLRLHPSGSGPAESLAAEFGVLAELQREGLIRHLGLSEVTSEQLTEAQSIAPVITVQNLYNVAVRHDDELVDRCARENIAYAAYFPLGGFTPLQAHALESVAKELETSTQQVALAWLLQRSPAIALIPGTSSRAHLQENLAAAELQLTQDAIRELDSIGAKSGD